MVHIAAHLGGLALLLAAFFSAGALVEYAAGSRSAARHNAGLVRLTLGIIVWIYLLFAFAVFGLLRPAIVGAVAAFAILIAILVGWRDRRVHVGGGGPFPSHSRDRASASPATESGPGINLIALAAPALVLLALFFVCLTPFLGWDDNAYHLTLPRLYVASGGFRRVPYNVYSNWPLNIELLYALAILVQDYVLAKLVHLTFLVLMAVAVYRLAAAHSSRVGGSFAAMLLLANPALLNEARFAYVDIALGFFFLMAFVFALQHLDERRTPPLLLAGLCCGVVAGAKLTGAAAAPCIALFVVISRTVPPRVRELRAAVRDVMTWVALPALALALPWYIRSYVYTGNPFYPLFYQSFGGPEWSTGLEQQFLHWQQSIGMGRRLVDYLLLPARVALESRDDLGHFGARLNPVWSALVPLSLALAPSVQIIRRSLGVAGLYFLAWALTSQQARFLIPILPLLAVAAGVALATVLREVITHTGMASRKSSALRSALSLGVVVAIASSLLWPARFVLADGASAAREMLRRGIAVPGDAKEPVYRFISDRLPSTARLMLLNTSFGFFVDRDYVADSFFEASQMNDLLLDGGGGAAGISRRLRNAGVTHVLLSTDDWRIPYPRALWEFLADRGLTELIYTSPGGRYRVFRVRGTT